MYFKLLVIIASFFIFLTIAFIIWALKWHVLVRHWQIAKAKVQNQKDKAAFIKKHESEGKKPFSFEMGNIIIYAENSQRAALDYKNLKREQKTAVRNFKKPYKPSLKK